jgi:hypothetical protein
MNPSSLFKYIPFCAPEVANDPDLQQMRLDGFSNGEIWYPKASNLNDPFECYPDFELKEEDIDEIVESLTPEEFIFIKKKNQIESKQKLIKALKQPSKIGIPSSAGLPLAATEFAHRALFFATISALSSHYLSFTGVLSLTENPLDLIMWAHYGGNSTGICLEFERTADNTLGSDSTISVKYRGKRESIKFHERHSRKAEIISTKYNAWAYEKEWRHIQDQGDKLYPFPGKVIRVVFGLNCHPSTIELTNSSFGKSVSYEEVMLNRDFSLSTDCGLKHSLSKVNIQWPNDN